MEVKIKIEGLDQITEALALFVSAMKYKDDMVKTCQVIKEFPEKVSSETKETPAVTKEEEEITKNVETEQEEQALTLEEVRALTAKAVKKDRSAVKKILSEFEASSVSTLEKEHYKAFYKKVGELLG